MEIKKYTSQALKSFFEPSIIGDVETAKLIDMTKNKSDFSKFLIIPEFAPNNPWFSLPFQSLPLLFSPQSVIIGENCTKEDAP